MENKLELYNKAKDAYYNGSEPIMTDLEFDELESELGLENNGYVGSKSKNYTVKHPFIMGSISKVQVKFENDGHISYEKYVNDVNSYLKKSRHTEHRDWMTEITPKYDGCSFEIVIDRYGDFVSASTRGDGEYGKDISPWFMEEWERNFEPKMKNWIDLIHEDDMFFLDYFVIRGECLVRKDVFKKKYASDFTIPRSFVSGVLNQDWEGTQKQVEMRDDIVWVCYDYREVYENGYVSELCYFNLDVPGTPCDFFLTWDRFFNNDSFKESYEIMLDYRDRKCPYCLDGFVVKPFPAWRLNDLTRPRQEDCVAVKFTPEIVESELIGVEWKVGKTGEYFPTGILKEIILGGKKVNRVSLHNFDYITRNHLGEGSVVKISLAGDIIPFVYEVTNSVEKVFDVPNDTEVIEDQNSHCLHLMKKMTTMESTYVKFLNSVKVLKVDGIGERVATVLFDEVWPVENIISLMEDSGLRMIKETLVPGKSTDNIISALKDRRTKLTLPEIIESEGFENCGPKNALWLAKKLSGLNPPEDGIPQTIIKLSETHDFNRVMGYVERFGVPMLVEEKEKKIPVILTGEPSGVTPYKTKSEWLKAHPQYKQTTKWTECKILFTNDMDSNTSKMETARKRGIEIRIYEK